jgi:hypothetical protein
MAYKASAARLLLLLLTRTIKKENQHQIEETGIAGKIKC